MAECNIVGWITAKSNVSDKSMAHILPFDICGIIVPSWLELELIEFDKDLIESEIQ